MKFGDFGGCCYVPNVSIIFYCSMLLYYLFWMFMGFTLHFYIIFGTNLLNGGPDRIAVFFAYFSVSKKMNIKRSPNGMKPSGAIFLEQMQTRGLGVDVKQRARRSRGCPAHPVRVGAPPHSENLGPFRERFCPAHKTRSERGDMCVWECRITKRTTGKRTGCKF